MFLRTSPPPRLSLSLSLFLPNPRTQLDLPQLTQRTSRTEAARGLRIWGH